MEASLRTETSQLGRICLGMASDGEFFHTQYTLFRLDDFQPKPGPIAGTLDWLGALQPLEEVSDECRIPFEESDADILMIAAEDDHNFESAEWAEAARWKLIYF